jgi:hypothetical protein
VPVMSISTLLPPKNTSEDDVGSPTATWLPAPETPLVKAEASPTSVNGRLVYYLDAEKQTIMTDWMERVRCDSGILMTETLNTVALKNRLPHIFDDLMDTLRLHDSLAVAEQTGKDAAQHGATRMRQGYEVAEMLREIKHLRALLIHHMRAFEDLNPEDGTVAGVLTSVTVHSFLDEMAISATEQYLSLQANRHERPLEASTRW